MPDQLQLSKSSTTLPFIWVPNQNGSVSKVNTETGKEIGRYRVVPEGIPTVSTGSPSRTTVDQKGNCWVGVRYADTAVNIGLLENGQWVDRNGDGICQTLTDANNNGAIDAAEMPPFGQDECVLWEVSLVSGNEGTFRPGTYPGPYDDNYWGAAPRAFAVDQDNSIWTATQFQGNPSLRKLFRLVNIIDPVTGKDTLVIDDSKTVSLSFLNTTIGPYGALIDRDGYLWIAVLSAGVLKIDPDNSTDRVWIPLYHTYGIGIDHIGHVFIAGGGQLSRITAATATLDWTVPAHAARGVCVTDDNNVWVAYTTIGVNVTRYTNDGAFVSRFNVGNGPTGVAVDAAGKVWACNVSDETIARIDPNGGSDGKGVVDLVKNLAGTGGHYSYSDMTGVIARTITAQIGTFSVVHDGGLAGAPWGVVSWNALVPEGSDVRAEIRGSEDGVTFGPYTEVQNGLPISDPALCVGRYVEVRLTARLTSGNESPSTTDPLNYTEQGTYYVTWLYTDDNGNQRTQKQTVVVNDITPPVLVLADLPALTGQCGVEVTQIPEALDNCVGAVTGTTTDPLTYTDQGNYVIVWHFNDGHGNEATQEQNVVVKDDTKPVVSSITVSRNILWSPNHKMVPVVVGVSATDNCTQSGQPTSRIVSVSCNEPAEGDWEITGGTNLSVRATRLGTGNGRIYTIVIATTDAVGNETTSTATVSVPHDQRK